MKKGKREKKKILKSEKDNIGSNDTNDVLTLQNSESEK